MIVTLLLAACAQAWPSLPLGPTEIKVNDDFFAGNETVVYLEDLETGMVYAVNGSEVEKRHTPFSTFKIPNFLIALETGTVSDMEQPIPYDSARRPEQQFWPADWAQDQTLRSAFQRSAAWAFQDLALKIGESTYRGYLDHFAYGNEEAVGDDFWLNGPLAISPKEQVDFLRKLLDGQFEIAPLHIEALKEAALQKDSTGFQLYAKTGSGPVKDGEFDGPFEGWYVGWLERPNSKPVLFALWTRGENYSAVKDYRKSAVLRLLEQADYLPLAW